MYNIEYTQEAINDLKRLQKSEPKVYEKARRLIAELAEHPKTGLGHPEPLKGQPEGRWSRELTKKHRLVYRMYEHEVVVLVLSAYGHYDDKEPYSTTTIVPHSLSVWLWGTIDLSRREDLIESRGSPPLSVLRDVPRH